MRIFCLLKEGSVGLPSVMSHAPPRASVPAKWFRTMSAQSQHLGDCPRCGSEVHCVHVLIEYELNRACVLGLSALDAMK